MEDLNRPITVTLTEGQISTILWSLEGYIQGNDDYSEESAYGIELDSIFEVLENAVDEQGTDYGARDVEKCIIDGTDYRDCVDHMVQSMEAGQ